MFEAVNVKEHRPKNDEPNGCMEIFVDLNLEHIFLRVLQLSIQEVLNVTVQFCQPKPQRSNCQLAIRHAEV